MPIFHELQQALRSRWIRRQYLGDSQLDARRRGRHHVRQYGIDRRVNAIDNPLAYSTAEVFGKRELGEQLKAQSFSTFYHDFVGLIRKNPAYYDIIKSWSDAVNTKDSLGRATKTLLAIGHTAEDIKSAYGLLYRKLKSEDVEELIGLSEKRLQKEQAVRVTS